MSLVLPHSFFGHWLQQPVSPHRTDPAGRSNNQLNAISVKDTRMQQPSICAESGYSFQILRVLCCSTYSGGIRKYVISLGWSAPPAESTHSKH